MDGRRDGWVDGRTDGWTDGQMDGRTDGRTDGWTDGRTDGRTDGQADRQLISEEGAFLWLSKGDLKTENESEIVAAQDQALQTKY
jgi:hypothetical protein